MRFFRWAFPSFIAFAAWYKDTHTAVGRIYVATMVIGCGLLLTSYPFSLELLSAFVAFAIVCKLLSVACQPRLAAKLKGIHTANCGVETAFVAVLKNPSRLPVFDVHIAFAALPGPCQGASLQSSVAAIPPHGELQVSGALTAYRRGVFGGPVLSLQSTFPFNLYRSKTLLPVAGELVVYPYRAPEIPLRLTECFGALGLENAGAIRVDGSGDFAGNCEYRAGMPVRRWDHRSWARLNRLCVHQYDDATSGTVALIVDTATPNEELFERVLSLAATLIHACQSRDVTISQLCHAGAAMEGPSSAEIEHDAALETLARLNQSHLHAVKNLQRSLALLPDGAAVLLLLTKWDKARAQACQDLTNRTQNWLGWLIADEEPSPEQELPQEINTISWKLPLFHDLREKPGLLI